MISQEETLPLFGMEDSLVDYPGRYSLLLAFWNCNMDCDFCFVRDSIKNPDRKFQKPIYEVIDLFRRGKDLYNGLVLSGGEPTLYIPLIRSLCELVKKLEQDIDIRILTNGTNTKFLQEMFDAGLIDSCLISLKHPDDLQKDDYMIDLLNILEFTYENKDSYDISYNIVETENVINDKMFQGFCKEIGVDLGVDISWTEERQ